MRIRFSAVVLAACIPVAVFAQKKSIVPADPGDASATAASGRSAPPTPTARDLSDMNPAALLVNKHKKLSLPDSVVTKLKAVEKQISERNAKFLTQYDSVHKWTLPLVAASSSANGPGFKDADQTAAAPTISPAEQAKMQSSLRDLRGLMADFRERRKTDDADALAVIPEAQKKGAADLLDQQDDALDKLLSGRP
jgi:hypothetical protein